MLGGILPDNLFDPVESFFGAYSRDIAEFFARLAIDLPPDAWWMPIIVLGALGGTAIYDAKKGRVPDLPIFFGLLAAVATLGFFQDWPTAGMRLAYGFGAAIVLWLINQLYYNWQKNDAIGMGDAKWTALAITGFTLKPALYAWVIGAWLGLVWLVVRSTFNFIHGLFSRAAKREEPFRVHFAPFLFIGLLAGLYWEYLR